MTGPDHYRLAQQDLDEALERDTDWSSPADAAYAAWLVSIAQVHATLAVAAATAGLSGKEDWWGAMTS